MLPVKIPSFDLYLAEGDIRANGLFPPRRFRERNDFLHLMHDFYEGDYRQLLSAQNQTEAKRAQLIGLPFEFPQAAADTTAHVLLLPPVATNVDLAEGVLPEVLSEVLIDMVRYGGSILETGRVSEGEDGSFRLNTVDPRYWYPVDGGGHVFFRTFVSPASETSQPDRARLTAVRPDGSTEVTTYEWQASGQLGAVIGEPEELGETLVTVVARSPRRGDWGTSAFPRMMSPVLEITKRLTKNSMVLDKNSDPRIEVAMDDGSAQQLYGGSTVAGSAEADEAIRKGLRGEYQGQDGSGPDVVRLRNAKQRARYLEFGADYLPNTQVQKELMMEVLHMTSYLPGLLQSFNNPASGVALQQQFFPLWAETRDMHLDVANRMQEALSWAFGGDVELDWPHVFEWWQARQDERQQQMFGGGQQAAEDIPVEEG